MTFNVCFGNDWPHTSIFYTDIPTQMAFLSPGLLHPANVYLQRDTWKGHQQKYQCALLQEC